MALAQRQLEGIVQLFATDRFAVEVAGHQAFVGLDDLVADLVVGGGQRKDVRVARIVKEAVANRGAAVGGQVDRETLRTELLAQVADHGFEIEVFGVDPIDDDHPAQASLAGAPHQPARRRLDSVAGVDHDRRGFHRTHRGQGRAAEIRVARGIDELDLVAVVVDSRKRRVQRMAVLLLEGLEIRKRIALLDGSDFALRSGGEQQAFEQRSLPGAGVAEQGERSDGGTGPAGHGNSLRGFKPHRWTDGHRTPVVRGAQTVPAGGAIHERFKRDSERVQQENRRLAPHRRTRPEAEGAPS